MSKPCDRVTLADGPVGRVDLCTCCSVASVHVGVVSLRLDEDALRCLAITLNESVRELGRHQARGDVRPNRGADA